MWRVISFLSLFWVLFGFYLPAANAETIPAPVRSHSYWFVSGGQCVSDDAVSNAPACKLTSASAMCSYLGGGVQEAKSDIVFCDNGRTGFPQKDTYRGACPPGYESQLYGTECYRPDPPKPDPPKDCPSPDVMAITCSALAGKYQQKGMITPTMGPGCDTGGGNSQMQQCGAGCGMTTRQVVTPTAAYLAHVYTGAYCKPDGSVTDGSYVKTPPTNKVCPEGQVYGEVNDVPTCLNSRQEPGKQAPETTSPDSCPKGSVSIINVTTGKPMGCVDPADTSKPCPDGTYKVTQGGMTTCQGTATTPSPSSPPGSGGSSGHSGGPKPGGGGSTGGTPNPKPGDSSSPTPEKPSDKPCDEQFPAGLKWVCGLGDGLPGPDGNQGPTTENGGDISGMLDTSDFFGGGSCPAPHVLSVNVGFSVWNWNVEYDPLCRFILMMRPGVIAVSMLTALFIIFKRG